MPTALQLGLQKPSPPKKKPEEIGATAVGTAISPAAQPPHKPAQPLLDVGFGGSIEEFNNRVQQIITAHNKEFGFDPSPALTMDIARATIPGLDQMIPSLFQGHHAPREIGAFHKDVMQNPWEYMYQRSDGRIQMHNPFEQAISSYVPPALPAKHQISSQEFQVQASKYPMIAQGYLPVPGFHTFIQAIGRADAYEKNKSAGQVYGGFPRIAEQIRWSDKNTVKDTQEYLQKLRPEYFGDLPVDGNYNDSWVKATVQYMHDKAYWRDSLKKQAHENFLNVNDYIRADTAKNHFIKNHSMLSQLAASVPLTFWASNSGPDVLHELLKYLKGNSSDPVTAGLTGIIHTGKLVWNLAGGSFNQFFADATAMNSFLQNYQSGKTFEESVKRMNMEARRNPTLVRLIAPMAMEGAPEWMQALDEVATFGVLISSGKWTGTKIAANDRVAFMRHPWPKQSTEWAYNAVKKGDPLRVASRTLNGSGGEALVAHLQANPEMTLQEFRDEAQKIFSGESEVSKSPIFRDLRSKSYPTPRLAGRTQKQIGRQIGRMARDFEFNHKDTNHAIQYARAVAGGMRHAAPRGEVRKIFGPEGERFVENIYNWAQVNLKNTAVANKLADEALVLKVKGEAGISGLMDLQQKMVDLFHEANPEMARKGPIKIEAFDPLIESDLPGEFYFPAPELTSRAAKINAQLNKIGGVHRQIIVSGLPLVATSLFYKHAFADTLRRFASDTGQLLGLSAGGRAARTDLNSLLETDPALRRRYESALLAAKQGEFRWLTRAGHVEVESFKTGEHFSDPHYMLAAGKYLRRHLNDDALTAFLQSSKNDKEAIRKYIMGSKGIREGILYANPEYSKSLQELRDSIGAGQLSLDFKTMEQGEAYGIESNLVREQLAQDHAELIFHRYNEIQESLDSQGKTLEDARIASMQGDKNLGEWLKDHNIDLKVNQGKIEYQTGFDAVTQGIIKRLMAPNKWNRGKLYHYVLHETLSDLQNAGWNLKEAFPVASDIALQQTVYHMLDFSNMLQAEQDFRWISYFATKHRLYWTWIAKHFAQAPGHAALLKDMSDELNLDKGNFNFDIAGHGFTIPFGRLLWVNNREYPEISSLLQGIIGTGANIAKGEGTAALNTALTNLTSTSGNLLTRDDQMFMMTMRMVRMETGKHYTFESATSGMTAPAKYNFATRMLDYGLNHRKNGVLPPEEDAVKAAMLGSVMAEGWRANLPVPILEQVGKPKHVQQEFDEFNKIFGPKKKAEYLQNHPDLRDWFGISNPDTWWHNRPLWDKFQVAKDTAEKRKVVLWEQVYANNGIVTIKDEKEIQSISADLGKAINEIKKEDAQTWKGPGDPPWTTQFNGSPLSGNAFLHQVFKNISNQELDAHTVTKRIVNLRNERNWLAKHLDNHTLKDIGYTKEKALERLRQIGIITDPFRAYPITTPAKAQRMYTDMIKKYRLERDAKGEALKAPGVASQDKDRLYSEFRAWKDSHDHPVEITVGGKKFTFPSVVQIGYANLDGPTRQQALSGMAGADYMHLAKYELKMLGFENLPKGLGKGQTLYEQTLEQWHQDPNIAQVKAADRVYLAKAVDKYYPGFYKFWLMTEKPKISRLKLTSVYRSMEPAVKSLLDANLFSSAEAITKAIAANGNTTFYKKVWRNYVKTEFIPWMKDHPLVKHEVMILGGMDFLNTLVG